MSKVFNSTNTAKTINDAISNIMGTTTTSQGATADGLIVKEDLQPVVECVNGFDYAVHIKTITGIPPLTFHSMGQTLIWSLDGNTDSGDSVGNKTDNLFNYDTKTDGYRIQWLNGVLFPDAGAIISDFIPVNSDKYACDIVVALSAYDENLEYLGVYGGVNTLIQTTPNEFYNTFTLPSNVKYVRIFTFSSTATNLSSDTMFNVGETALPYEPYGYDVPIKVNSTDTYHCYITDVLRKSDGETPVYDTMSSDGTIIRRVDTDGTALDEPITETYTAPNVIVSWGNNTIDVDTTVSPTSMTITYKDN